MTNKIFIQNQQKIRKCFKKYVNHFYWNNIATNPNLHQYKKFLKSSIGQMFLDLNNYFIYYTNLSNPSIFKNDPIFSSKYYYLLKGLCLVILTTSNDKVVNIFDREYQVKNTKYASQLYIDKLNDEYLKKLNLTSDLVYSYVCELSDLMNVNINLHEFYSLIVNIQLLFIIKDSLYAYKTIGKWKFKTKKELFSEDKTMIYLSVFKQVRQELQKNFQNFFNDLIFLINS